ncbi:dethiobiotin synthase [Thalassotalea ganghwensis]
MSKRLFITATDTDAGKTHFSRALIRALTNQHYKVSAYKPISAGCECVNGELVNEDAKLLLEEVNTPQRLKQVNPIAFEEPIAPHIAAKYQQKAITIEQIIIGYQDIQANNNADIIVTEGAGGWRLPLGNKRFLSEFAQESSQSVILVVNIKLGCLNHALLTYEAISDDGLRVVGWVANCQDDNMPYQQDNIEELCSLIPAPLIATFNANESIETAANKIQLDFLK